MENCQIIRVPRLGLGVDQRLSSDHAADYGAIQIVIGLELDLHQNSPGGLARNALAEAWRNGISGVSEGFALLRLLLQLLINRGLVGKVVRNGAIDILKGGEGREILENGFRRGPLAGTEAQPMREKREYRRRKALPNWRDLR